MSSTKNEQNTKNLVFKAITIEGLFGRFNHEIEFKPGFITLIAGLNGTGKTTVLKIINYISQGELEELIDIPFSRILCDFESHRNVEFKKIKDGKIPYLEISNGFTKFYFVTLHSALPHITDRPFFHEKMSFIRYSYLYSIAQSKRSKSHESEDSNGDYSLSKALTKLLGLDEESSPLIVTSRDLPGWLTNIVKSLNCHYIREQRLFAEGQMDLELDLDDIVLSDNEEEEDEYDDYDEEEEEEEPEKKRTIEYHSSELKERINSVVSNYASSADELDRNFPFRVLNVEFSDIKQAQSPSDLEQSYSEWTKFRNRVINAGLLKSTEVKSPEINFDDLDQWRSVVLKYFIEDSKKKLSIFTKLLERIELFKEILEDHLRYVSVSFSKDYGVRFHDKKEKNIVIDPEKLSSGEQHLFVLIYELIFQTKENSLVLIDEPEISLHISWQLSLIDNLSRIGRIRNVYFLLATHSPQIVNGRWHLVNTLGDEPIDQISS